MHSTWYQQIAHMSIMRSATWAMQSFSATVDEGNSSSLKQKTKSMWARPAKGCPRIHNERQADIGDLAPPAFGFVPWSTPVKQRCKLPGNRKRDASQHRGVHDSSLENQRHPPTPSRTG